MDELNNFGSTAEARDIRHHFHGYTNARRHMDVGPMIIEDGAMAKIAQPAADRIRNRISVGRRPQASTPQAASA